MTDALPDPSPDASPDASPVNPHGVPPDTRTAVPLPSQARPAPAGFEHLATALIQHPYRAPGGFDAVPVGVFKASTVIFENTQALNQRRWQDKSGYTYGLHGTPTTFTLEERLSTLEGGHRTLLLPSGLAAIAMVCLSILRSGDEVLLPDNVYGPSRDLALGELAALGITHRLYDPMDAQSLAQAIGAQTRLVWLEAAGSVTLEFPDLRALLTIVRQHPQVVAALDNTWGAGLAFAPFELGVQGPGGSCGADISVHALTKYPSGGADVLMGAITTRCPQLHAQLSRTHMRMGLGVGANDAEAVLRGLPTMALRYAAQDSSARRIAQALLQRTEPAAVLHPALPGAPGHEAWASTCVAAAGLVSFVLKGPQWPRQRALAWVDALRRFKIGYSWGGPVSLVMPYELNGLRRLGPWQGQQGTLVRLATGLEAVEDLLEDVQQAFAVVHRHDWGQEP